MPAKYNRGISPKRLFFKHALDTWGHFLMKRKFKYRATHRLLALFEINLRTTVVKLLKPLKFRFKWRHRRRFFGRRKRRKVRVVVRNPKLLRNLFFTNLFKYYSAYHKFSARQNALLSHWSKAHLARLRSKIPSFLYHLNRKRRAAGIDKLRIRRVSYNVEKKLDLLRCQQYFCLPTINQTKCFLRRHELNYFKMVKDSAFLGMEGNILSIIFRTNLFPTTRFGYALVKLGVVSVNGVSIVSPRKLLQVFDTIQFHPAFIKTLFYYFKRRLKRKLLLVNAPRYLSCNYKLMSFKIWRVPTEGERKYLNTYPFRRRAFDVNLDQISPDAFVDTTLE